MNEPLPAHVKDLLIALAENSPDREICGFIMKDLGIRPITNISEDDYKFDMEPSEQLYVFANFRTEILGVYHSHPSGSDYPSERDIWAAPRGMRYWIVTTKSVTEWVIEDGIATTVVAPLRSAAKKV